MTYKRNYYDRFDPWENAVVENPEKYGKKESEKMIDVEKIVNRVMADLDLDVCVICESVLVDSRNNVVCDDCLKVENDWY